MAPCVGQPRAWLLPRSFPFIFLHFARTYSVTRPSHAWLSFGRSYMSSCRQPFSTSQSASSKSQCCTAMLRRLASICTADVPPVWPGSGKASFRISSHTISLRSLATARKNGVRAPPPCGSPLECQSASAVSVRNAANRCAHARPCFAWKRTLFANQAATSAGSRPSWCSFQSASAAGG